MISDIYVNKDKLFLSICECMTKCNWNWFTFSRVYWDTKESRL